MLEVTAGLGLWRKLDTQLIQLHVSYFHHARHNWSIHLRLYQLGLVRACPGRVSVLTSQKSGFGIRLQGIWAEV